MAKRITKSTRRTGMRQLTQNMTKQQKLTIGLRFKDLDARRSRRIVVSEVKGENVIVRNAKTGLRSTVRRDRLMDSSRFEMV